MVRGSASAIPMLLFFLTQPDYGGALTLESYRFLRDPSLEPLYRHRLGMPVTEGGYLDLYLRNDSHEALTIKQILLDGQDIKQRPRFKFFMKMDGNWHSVYPNPIPQEGISTIRIRLPELEHLMPVVSVGVVSEKGRDEFEVELRQSLARLEFIGFSEKLDTVFVFVRNGSGGTLWLGKPRVFLNGLEAEVLEVKGESIPPGRLALLSLRPPKVLKRGDLVVVRLVTGERIEASGDVRAFPSKFYTSFWSVQSSADVRDLERLHITLATSCRKKGLAERGIESLDIARDEPMGGGIPPQELADLLNSIRAKTPQRLLAVQLTGEWENLWYAGLGDVTIHHHDPGRESDFVQLLTAPKPVWYLPQSTWQSWERLDFDAKTRCREWYAQESQDILAYQSVAHGAKTLMWFVYANLWWQGYQGAGSVEFDCNQPCPMMRGVVSNPLIWWKVEELSGTFQAIAPLLAISSVYEIRTTPEGIELSTIATNRNAVVVILVKRDRYRRFFPEFGVWAKVVLPPWVEAREVFAFNHLTGTEDARFRKCEDGILLDAGDILTARLFVVAGSEEIRKLIEERWRRLSPYADRQIDSFKKEKELWLPRTLPARRRRQPWREPSDHFRIPIEVRVTEPGEKVVTASINFALKREKDGTLDLSSLRLYAEDGAEVPLYLTHPYEKAMRGSWSGLFDGPLPERSEVNGAKIRLFEPRFKSGVYTWITPTEQKLEPLYPRIRLKWRGDALVYPIFYIRFPNVKNPVPITDHTFGRADVEEVWMEGDWFISEYNWYELALRWGSAKGAEARPEGGHLAIQYRGGELEIDSVTLLGANELTWKLESPQASTLHYELYYDVKENRPRLDGTPPPVRNLKHSGGIRVRCGEKEFASFEARVKRGFLGIRVKVHSDAKLKSCTVRAFGEGGSFMGSFPLRSKDGLRWSGRVPRLAKLLCIYGADWNGHIISNVTVLEELPAEKEPTSLKPLWEFPTPRYILRVAVAENGAWAVCASDKLYCISARGQLLWEQGLGAPVRGVRVVGNSILAWAGRWSTKEDRFVDNTLVLLKPDGSQKWTLDIDEGYIAGVDTTPDLSRVAVIHYRKLCQSALKLINSRGKVLWERLVPDYATSVCISPDGQMVAVGRLNNSWLLCFSGQGRQLFRFAAANGRSVPALYPLADRGIIFISEDLVRVDSQGKEVWRREAGAYPRTMAFAPQASTVVCGSMNGTLSAFKTDGKLLWQKRWRDRIINSLAISADGKTVVVASDRFAYNGRDRWQNEVALEVYDSGGQLLSSFRTEKRCYTDMASVDMTPDGTRVALGSYNGKLYFFIIK